jgi:hypothetical protein
MKQKVINLYSFDELSEKAKQKATENLWDINVYFEWWQLTYEDAARVGIEITGFDIDRESYCKGNIDDSVTTAHKIIEFYGNECETYKTAEAFLKERDEIIDTASKDENGDFEDERQLDNTLNECEEEFKKSILEDYRIMLQKEYEGLTSKEAIIETIEANEYTFTIDGELEN